MARKPVHGLMISADGTIEIREISGDLDSLQGIVGGPVEYVAFTASAGLFCHEEGKWAGLAVNLLATALTDHYRPGFASQDVLAGDVVILGMTPAGNSASCPPAIVEQARKLTTT